MNDVQYEKLLKSCTEQCTQPYCFLKMFFLKQHPSERMIVQLKCIEIAKWTWSAEAGTDIGWEATGLRWVTDGYAKAFAKAYNEIDEVLCIFKVTVDIVKSELKANLGATPF